MQGFSISLVSGINPAGCRGHNGVRIGPGVAREFFISLGIRLVGLHQNNNHNQRHHHHHRQTFLGLVQGQLVRGLTFPVLSPDSIKSRRPKSHRAGLPKVPPTGSTSLALVRPEILRTLGKNPSYQACLSTAQNGK